MVVNLFIDLVAEHKVLEQVKNELAAFWSKSIYLQKQANMLKHSWIVEQLRLIVQLLSQFCYRLYFIYRIQQVGYILKNIFLIWFQG